MENTYTHTNELAQAPNAHSYRAPFYTAAYDGVMDVQKTLAKILESDDWTQSKLAKALGTTQPTISRWLRGMDPGGKEREKIKQLANEVLDERIGSSPVIRGLYVPLISWIAAGSLRTPDAVEEIDAAPRVHAPDLDPKGEWIALKVEGDSMDRISPPESIIFVNCKDRRLVANACYVIADPETGAATYKRWRPNPGRWEPVSVNPTHEPLFIADGQPIRVLGRVRKSVLTL